MSPRKMLMAVAFAAAVLPWNAVALLFGGPEANHSLEECACCVPSDDCLVNVGPGSRVRGPTNKTFQHLLFETIEREIQDEPCLVEGKFPEWVAGSMFKNGFGKYESSKANYSFLSVFDAMAFVSRITIHKNGSVTATSKLTKNEWFNRSEGLDGYEPHIPAYRSFSGTEPDLSFWEKWRVLLTIIPDNLNVNIVRQGKRLFGISDMDGFQELDPNSLDYIQNFRYADRLSMSSTFYKILAVMTSAHPVYHATNPHLIYNFIAEPGGYLLQAAFVPMLISCITIWTSQKMVQSISKSKGSSSFIRFAVLLLVVAQVRWAFLAIDGQIDGVQVNKYTLYRLDTSKEPLRREEILSFPNKRLSYIHELAMTENYLILAEWPTFWDIGAIVNPFFNDPSKMRLEWNPSVGTKFIVVDIKKGRIVSEHSDLGPYWSYHQINAFEDGQGNIVMDACTFDNAEHLHSFETRTLRKNTYHIPRNFNRRFIIPVGKPLQNTIVRNIGPVGFDLPVKNPEYAGMKYRFAYGTGHRLEGEWWNSIVKVDMESGKTIQWFSEHTWPSQPTFVPNPERKSEDDGVLLTLMLDGPSRRSFILALDGVTFKEVARAWIPISLPYTSHGYFDAEFGGDKDSMIIPGVKNAFSIDPKQRV